MNIRWRIIAIIEEHEKNKRWYIIATFFFFVVCWDGIKMNQWERMENNNPFSKSPSIQRYSRRRRTVFEPLDDDEYLTASKISSYPPCSKGDKPHILSIAATTNELAPSSHDHTSPVSLPVRVRVPPPIVSQIQIAMRTPKIRLHRAFAMLERSCVLSI